VEHPPVAPVFYAFRVMVGVGMLMLAVSWFGWWQLRRGGLPGKPLLYALAGMTFSGWIATLAGWYVTEIGRQPWLVTGVLSTADAVTKTAGAGMVWTSLAMYLGLYVVLLAAYVATLYHLAGKATAAAGGRAAPETPIAKGGERLAASPLSSSAA
jgi:cytochrome d ubiquinol oxidase subunit I